MRPAGRFVKRVNTTYCAFLLGQSQDVDACGSVQVRPFGSQCGSQIRHRAQSRRSESRDYVGRAAGERGRLVRQVLRKHQILRADRVFGLADERFACRTAFARRRSARGSRSGSDRRSRASATRGSRARPRLPRSPASSAASSAASAALRRGFGRLGRRRFRFRRLGARALGSRRSAAARARTRPARLRAGSAGERHRRRRLRRRIGSTSRGGGAGMSSGGSSGVVFACACDDSRTSGSGRQAATADGRTRSGWCHASSSHACGSSSRNVVPAPGVDCTSISPSCICTVR